ncbi:TolC family protein [Leptothoe sp. PORK10 BA2]|uniref:TolC family protein n=1 Tax=Leptothoe sp. PORK10 BA2 TaxID=3110254 RepID=UPI002B21DCDC|nr:TolC family protein [Leptothoe sp. PORK10 BA2]MEA5462195.1 TolC family protein [Leptothoe sp. PORK10 BA2]
MASSTLTDQSVRLGAAQDSFLLAELNQFTQLPNLPEDEPANNDENSPPQVEDESADGPVDEQVDALPGNEAPVTLPIDIETGEIVPETGQAPSTAPGDLLDTSDLPPAELLADPNPLTVPTVESEVALPAGDERTITIEEAIELAYFNNQDLQVALLELEQQEAELAEARAAYAPVVTTSADLTAQEENSTQTAFGSVGNDGIDTTLDATVGVSYDLFTSGQRLATVRAAEEQVRLSELEVDRRREALRLETTSLYYDLQESGEQIRINQAFVEEAKRNQRDNSLRQQEGVGTRFDVLRADVQLANAQQAVVQSQADQRIARRNLARLLNLPSTLNINAMPVPAPENWDASYERWELTLEDSILLAFQGRVELEQQLVQREISTQRARAARAANRPQVSLFANYSWSDLLDNSSDTYNFGARFNMILADGGAARSRALQQELNADIAEERFSETLDQVRFEVEEAYFTLRSNEDNVRTASTAINQAAQALELAKLREAAGVGTQLDVLTATSELTQAEGNWVSAALGYNRALASLRRAVSNLRSTL